MNLKEKTNEIDKSLYSRQLYTIGKDAMNAIVKSSVMISGMSGLGLEIAKCVILTGAKSVTLHDINVIKQKDLSSNYYATPSDIGKNRADVVKNKLSLLNPYVQINVTHEIITETFFQKNKFDVVVFCDQFVSSQINNNKYARKYDTKYILANTMGLMGCVFCDFGDNFTTTDPDGETPASAILTKIENYYYKSPEPHKLYVGDIIKIMFNDDQKETIDEVDDVVDMFTFRTKKTKIKSKDLSNVSFIQMKKPLTINFESLEHSYNKDETDFMFVVQDNFDKQQLLHEFFKAVNLFAFSHNKLPCSDEDIENILLLMYDKVKTDNDKQFIKKIAKCCSGKLCPVDSIFGSIAAQEVIKAMSHKYTPIKQWLYLDFANVLNDDQHKINIADKMSDRYYGQKLIFGNDFQKKLETSHIFIVGAGAIGCELLKNLAMIGVGNITITDMDTIEKSNLNRQFLFSNDDIGKFKSDAAKNAILKMNPDIVVTSQTNKVASDTLNVYNDKFFSNITCVFTALDNVQARLFVDSMCINNKKPLIDSGTLGTKGSVQTIIPFLTETYGSTKDPEEKEIPMCTLKFFPYLIEHCIQWARDSFEGMFVKAPQNFMRYKKNHDEIKKMSPSELSEIHKDILFVHNNCVSHSKECIKFAHNLWYELFRDQIYHLQKKYPANCVTNEGCAFWSGTKKFPEILKLNLNSSDDELTNIFMSFIKSTANLWADVFNLDHVTDKQIMAFLKNAKEPKIKDVKIIVDDKKNDEELNSSNTVLELPPIDELEYDVTPLQFEKDDESNFHIDFITSCSNSRALNYKIQTANKFKTKGIAGKIIPAVITTTSLVSGLVCIEFLKLLNNVTQIEKYSNVSLNLATPFISFSEPIAIKKQNIGKYSYSIWDNLEFGNITIKNLIDNVYKIINDDTLEICGISMGQYTFFSTSTSKKNQDERMNMTLSNVHKHVCKIVNPETITLMISINKKYDSEKSDESEEIDYDPLLCKIVF